jgi:hypothetical protein
MGLSGQTPQFKQSSTLTAYRDIKSVGSMDWRDRAQLLSMGWLITTT